MIRRTDPSSISLGRAVRQAQQDAAMARAEVEQLKTSLPNDAAIQAAAEAQRNAALFGAIGTIGGALPSLFKKSPGALPTGATEWADWGDGSKVAANQNGRIIEGWGI